MSARREYDTAILVAFAAALQIAESFIPYPVPGAKLGLANIATMLALMRFGPGAAVTVAFLRTIVASLVLGTFLAPPFFLSLTGALGAALLSSLVYVVFVNAKRPFMSSIGVSVAGSVASILCQTVVAALFFVKTTALFSIVPYLVIIAVVTGWVNGYIAARMISSHRYERFIAVISGAMRPEALSASSKKPAMRPVLSVIGAFAAAVILAVSDAPLVGAAVAVIFIIYAVVLRVPLRALFRVLRKSILPIALFSFAAFLAANNGAVLAVIGGFIITQEGVSIAVKSAARLFLLSFNAMLLMRAVKSEDLVAIAVRCVPPIPVVRKHLMPMAHAAALALVATPHAVAAIRAEVNKMFSR
ncbi:MAG: Gx transporter family protein [Spirochaetes bacterium]|nr:Gx transporter family protein [Spirochaetota bacterium]